MISIGVNTQTRKNSAIMRAYENNHLDIVALLFSYGCDGYGIPEDHIYEVLQEYKIKLFPTLEQSRK